MYKRSAATHPNRLPKLTSASNRKHTSIRTGPRSNRRKWPCHITKCFVWHSAAKPDSDIHVDGTLMCTTHLSIVADPFVEVIVLQTPFPSTPCVSVFPSPLPSCQAIPSSAITTSTWSILHTCFHQPPSASSSPILFSTLPSCLHSTTPYLEQMPFSSALPGQTAINNRHLLGFS